MKPAISYCAAEGGVISKLHELVIEMSPHTLFHGKFLINFRRNLFLKELFTENYLSIAILLSTFLKNLFGIFYSQVNAR